MTDGEKRAAWYRAAAAGIRRGRWDVAGDPVSGATADERAAVRRAWYLAEIAQADDAGPRLDQTQARVALLLDEAARLAIASEVAAAMGADHA